MEVVVLVICMAHSGPTELVRMPDMATCEASSSGTTVYPN